MLTIEKWIPYSRHFYFFQYLCYIFQFLQSLTFSFGTVSRYLRTFRNYVLFTTSSFCYRHNDWDTPSDFLRDIPGIYKPSIENCPSEAFSCEKIRHRWFFASGIYQMKLQSSAWRTLARSIAKSHIFRLYQRNSSCLYLFAQNKCKGVIRENKNVFPDRMRHLIASNNIGSLLSLLSLLNSRC